MAVCASKQHNSFFLSVFLQHLDFALTIVIIKSESMWGLKFLYRGKQSSKQRAALSATSKGPIGIQSQITTRKKEPETAHPAVTPVLRKFDAPTSCTSDKVVMGHLNAQMHSSSSAASASAANMQRRICELEVAVLELQQQVWQSASQFATGRFILFSAFMCLGL